MAAKAYHIISKEVKRSLITVLTYAHSSLQIDIYLLTSHVCKWVNCSSINSVMELSQTYRLACMCFYCYSLYYYQSLMRYRSSRSEVFCKKGVLKNFAKFTGKHQNSQEIHFLGCIPRCITFSCYFLFECLNAPV